MTQEVIVQVPADSNHAVVVRTYSNKGKTVNDGVTLNPGDRDAFLLDATTFIQVDGVEAHAASNKGVSAPAPAEDGRTEIERLADEEAAKSRAERGVTKEDDLRALGQEALDELDAELDGLFDGLVDELADNTDYFGDERR